MIMWSTAYKNGVIPSGQLPYTTGINTGSSAINAAASADSAASARTRRGCSYRSGGRRQGISVDDADPDHHSPLPGSAGHACTLTRDPGTDPAGRHADQPRSGTQRRPERSSRSDHPAPRPHLTGSRVADSDGPRDGAGPTTCV